MTPAKIRVLVADDSLTVRKHLVAVLAADPALEVIGEAEDGQSAFTLCQQLRPDVITLDMIMPVMGGLAATEMVMAYCPTPILIVSASLNRGDVVQTYEALAAGAVDVLEKPSGAPFDRDWAERFVATVKLVSRIKVITHPRARLSALRDAMRGRSPMSSACRVVAIGASTGGPAALVAILRRLPAEYPIPILLVIHIAPSFTTRFAEWLDGQTALAVRYARDGEPVDGGRGVIVAVPDQHLFVRQGRLCLNTAAERHSCRPSVDVLFESVAEEFAGQAAGVLLTGMGKDGAAGLLAIRRAGGITFAQDEATSVVFGMPREAIALGAASRVLPIDDIAPVLTALADRPPEDR